MNTNEIRTGEYRKVNSRISKLIALLRNPFYRRTLFRYRVAAAVEHDALLKRLGKDLRTVVDIGANRGQFALVPVFTRQKPELSPLNRWKSRRRSFKRCSGWML